MGRKVKHAKHGGSGRGTTYSKVPFSVLTEQTDERDYTQGLELGQGKTDSHGTAVELADQEGDRDRALPTGNMMTAMTDGSAADSQTSAASDSNTTQLQQTQPSWATIVQRDANLGTARLGSTAETLPSNVIASPIEAETLHENQHTERLTSGAERTTITRTVRLVQVLVTEPDGTTHMEERYEPVQDETGASGRMRQASVADSAVHSPHSSSPEVGRRTNASDKSASMEQQQISRDTLVHAFADEGGKAPASGIYPSSVSHANTAAEDTMAKVITAAAVAQGALNEASAANIYPEQGIAIDATKTFGPRSMSLAATEAQNLSEAGAAIMYPSGPDLDTKQQAGLPQRSGAEEIKLDATRAILSANMAARISEFEAVNAYPTAPITPLGSFALAKGSAIISSGSDVHETSAVEMYPSSRHDTLMDKTACVSGVGERGLTKEDLTSPVTCGEEASLPNVYPSGVGVVPARPVYSATLDTGFSTFPGQDSDGPFGAVDEHLAKHPAIGSSALLNEHAMTSAARDASVHSGTVEKMVVVDTRAMTVSRWAFLVQTTVLGMLGLFTTSAAGASCENHSYQTLWGLVTLNGAIWAALTYLSSIPLVTSPAIGTAGVSIATPGTAHPQRPHSPPRTTPPAPSLSLLDVKRSLIRIWLRAYRTIMSPRTARHVMFLSAAVQILALLYVATFSSSSVIGWTLVVGASMLVLHAAMRSGMSADREPLKAEFTVAGEKFPDVTEFDVAGTTNLVVGTVSSSASFAMETTRTTVLGWRATILSSVTRTWLAISTTVLGTVLAIKLRVIALKLAIAATWTALVARTILSFHRTRTLTIGFITASIPVLRNVALGAAVVLVICGLVYGLSLAWDHLLEPYVASLSTGTADSDMSMLGPVIKIDATGQTIVTETRTTSVFASIWSTISSAVSTTVATLTTNLLGNRLVWVILAVNLALWVLFSTIAPSASTPSQHHASFTPPTPTPHIPSMSSSLSLATSFSAMIPSLATLLIPVLLLFGYAYPSVTGSCNMWMQTAINLGLVVVVAKMFGAGASATIQAGKDAVAHGSPASERHIPLGEQMHSTHEMAAMGSGISVQA